MTRMLLIAAGLGAVVAVWVATTPPEAPMSYRDIGTERYCESIGMRAIQDIQGHRCAPKRGE